MPDHPMRPLPPRSVNSVKPELIFGVASETALAQAATAKSKRTKTGEGAAGWKKFVR